MQSSQRSIEILMADDDKDDQLLIRDALNESLVRSSLRIVNDGKELIEYLQGKEQFSGRDINAQPDLILLDLNMPRMDGRQALAAIKSDPVLRRIPVIILTTSTAEEDMLKAYDLGAASYFSKPVTYGGLVELMKTLGRYWVEFVELPGKQIAF